VKAFYVGDNDNSLTVTDGGGIYVWGPQLEEGTTASSFVANTTGSPKFITGATFGPRVPMVLIEPSATNLVPNSSSFNALSSATLISNIAAPDGSDDAKRISNAQAVNTTFAKSSTISIPTGVSADYVGSVYVRGTAGDTVSVFMKRQSGGTFVTSGSRNVLLTGDWQRVENLALTSDPTNSNLAIYASSAGKTADSIDLWGGQIETGSVSTSVIPTSGGDAAARTRAADDLVISGSDFTDFYNASEGTFYVESELQRATEVGFQPFLFDADNGDGNRVLLYNETAGDVLGLVKNVGTGYEINLGTHPDVNTFSRTAFSYKSNNLQGSKDGNSVTPITIAVIPTTINTLNVGSHYTKAENLYLNGRIKRLIYWPTESGRL
jgi:hypothetical protein